MTEIDIRKLTQEAEAGHACAVKDVIETIPFEQSLQVLKAISRQNISDRSADPNIPEIRFSSRGYAWGSVAELYVPAAHWYSNPTDVVSDQLAIKDTSRANIGERQFQCRDIVGK